MVVCSLVAQRSIALVSGHRDGSATVQKWDYPLYQGFYPARQMKKSHAERFFADSFSPFHETVQLKFLPVAPSASQRSPSQF